ncbi:MAG: hypothetical protein JRN21_00635 [Nitrososphaerota archaeon]|nr:hypothetical protein [Nitrososphaerota archaeon]
MSDSEPPSFVRVTIDVPQDTLNTLDRIKEFAGYSSRGRTIQALIDAIGEMSVDSQNINQARQEFSQLGQKNLPSAEQLVAFFATFAKYANQVDNLLRRLSRFAKVS